MGRQNKRAISLTVDRMSENAQRRQCGFARWADFSDKASGMAKWAAATVSARTQRGTEGQRNMFLVGMHPVVTDVRRD
ncbi:hypothetical protein NL54_12100 [Pantoea stewartii]|nr:hypothetical protein NL54_12100 [Pantoea stewartii]KHN63451.1 hypothetical protein OI73_08935 [Pantoea stewartii]